MPGSGKCRGAFALQTGSQLADIHALAGDGREYFIRIDAIRRHDAAQLAMRGEGMQRSFRPRIDGVRR